MRYTTTLSKVQRVADWAVLYSLSEPLQDPTLTELQASLSVFLLFIFAFFSIVAWNV